MSFLENTKGCKQKDASFLTNSIFASFCWINESTSFPKWIKFLTKFKVHCPGPLLTFTIITPRQYFFTRTHRHTHTHLYVYINGNGLIHTLYVCGWFIQVMIEKRKAKSVSDTWFAYIYLYVHLSTRFRVCFCSVKLFPTKNLIRFHFLPKILTYNSILLFRPKLNVQLTIISRGWLNDHLKGNYICICKYILK